MLSLLKWARAFGRRAPLTPLQFPTTGFEVVPESKILEEELYQDALNAGQYYPVEIGDIYAQKYQILGKLGFGTTSPVSLPTPLCPCVCSRDPSKKPTESINMWH